MWRSGGAALVVYGVLLDPQDYTHRRQCGVSTTSSTKGSNSLGKSGQARRIALFLLRALERRWRTRRGSLSRRRYPDEEQERDEVGARYQERGRALEGDTATGGGAPCARGRHAMEPERRRHQFQPLRALRA